jgi:hypothetical protein
MVTGGVVRSSGFRLGFDDFGAVDPSSKKAEGG